MKALITGITGFAGSHLADYLLAEQPDVEFVGTYRWRSRIENIAHIEENRAKVVEAEAEVPKAISQAFREGALGIMDYYKLRNVQADTDMRASIAKTGTPSGKGGSAA